MSKKVSQGAISFLRQQTGTEPAIVIGIAWNLGTSWYSSREAYGYTSNVMQVGSVRSQKRVDSMSTTSSVNVTFSDTDGSMSRIMNGRNMEKAPAVVYLAFGGGSTNDFVELIRGVTVGPAQWDEGARTMSFDIESIVTSDELGYSATREDFDDLAEGAYGVPWPMIFGSCAHVPALKVREHTKGFLKFPIQLYKRPSYRLINDKKNIRLNPNPDVFCYVAEPPTKNKFWVEGGDKFPQGKEISLSILDTIFKGSFAGDLFTVTESNAPRFVKVKFGARSGADAQNYSVAWIADDKISLVNHHIYFKVNSAYVWYAYVVKQEGKKIWFKNPVVSPVTNKLVLINSAHQIQGAYVTPVNGMTSETIFAIQRQITKLEFRTDVPDKDKFGKLKSFFDKAEQSASAWWQASSDEEVHLWDQEDPDIYIASLIELSEIIAVFGKRKIKTDDGKTKDIFEQVPTQYYEVQLKANYKINANSPSGLLFYKALESYVDQGWTGELYVTGTSTVGPNSARIIKWILQNYTTLKPDPSFNSVITKVSALEAHFALFDKRDALKVAQEIAFQSRCGLIMDSERIGIRFLAEQPVGSLIVTEENTEFDSLTRTSTPTSDVATKLIATWTETYREKHRLGEVHQKHVTSAERVLNSLVPSNRRSKSETRYTYRLENVKQYGLQIREEACYIYPVEENVQIFLNFWGHRLANSWQLVNLKLPLDAVLLQVWDGVTFNYTDGSLLATVLILGQVESVDVNPSDWSVSLGVWLPRKAGSIFVDSKAW